MSHFLCMFYKMQCKETNGRIINIVHVTSINKFLKIDHNDILNGCAISVLWKAK